MLFFLSKHYFTSRNCLREVKASLDKKRPLVLVHEQQGEKGGGPLETIWAECRKEMRSDIFDGRTPITWHRVFHYQNLTLKLIATEMLRHGPKYNDSLHSTSSLLAQLIEIATPPHERSSRNSSRREELTPGQRNGELTRLVANARANLHRRKGAESILRGGPATRGPL